MGRKYLIPILVGVGVLILLLVAGALFFSGSPELGTGALLTAAAVGEAARRNQGREEAEEALDEEARKAEAARRRLKGLQKEDEALDEEVTDKQAANAAHVANTSLKDLVDEANERDA